MIKKDFVKRLEELDLHSLDPIILTLRGIYGNYRVEGVLDHIDERGFIHLDKGFAHSYKKLISIKRSEEL